MYKIIEVKQSVFEDNNKDANKLREECKVLEQVRQQLYLER